MKKDEVILVNENDEEIGTMEKMQAHREGKLHRAFSIFIFDSRGRMLLQQRSAKKYHGGLLWSNTCCSHPFPGEDVADAAERRLREEMGFEAPVAEIFSFTYRADVENGLIEHEYDHVFAGEYEDEVQLNPHEVASYCFSDIARVKQDLAERPERFTSWFRIIFPRIEKWWEENYGTKNSAA